MISISTNQNQWHEPLTAIPSHFGSLIFLSIVFPIYEVSLNMSCIIDVQISKVKSRHALLFFLYRSFHYTDLKSKMLKFYNVWMKWIFKISTIEWKILGSFLWDRYNGKHFKKKTFNRMSRFQRLYVHILLEEAA